MERDDIIYVKDTIDWINNNSDLIDKSRTNCETLYAIWANSMNILERALAENTPTSSEQLATPAVSNSVSLERKVQLAMTGLEIISKNGDGASSEYARELMSDIANCC